VETKDAPPKRASGAAGAPGGAGGTGGTLLGAAGGAPGANPSAVIEKPFRPGPDSGVLFLDLRRTP
jgi:hypothetical protein